MTARKWADPMAQQTEKPWAVMKAGGWAGKKAGTMGERMADSLVGHSAAPTVVKKAAK